jgi:long-chain acyl-CoA synthetase
MNARTVPDALDEVFKKYSGETAFVHRQAFYRQSWTFTDVRVRIGQMIAFLELKNLGHGDTVAICGTNSPWWLVVYLACAVKGIVIVPLDVNSTAEFIEQIMAETKPKLFFKSVFKVYEGEVATVLLEDAAHILPADTAEVHWTSQVSPEDVLEIVFTSGSTGAPKGVVLTHANVLSNAANFLEAWPPQGHQTSLSLVPLSHMLEQTAGFWAPFQLGCTVVYIDSLRPTEIARALLEERVTCIITVPAFLQLLRRRIAAQTEQHAIATGIVRLAARLPQPGARFVSWPIRRKFGSQLRTLAVGGAALPAEIEDFWTHLGLTVIQGYGLTEASPLATYSTRLAFRPRSVGKGLPNQELKIVDNGELLLRGPHVFQGYYRNKEATKQVLDDAGWLHTGDIAEIDADGFVFLKGRLKNMLLGSNGLNIYPEDIEAKLLNYSGIRDVVVLMTGSSDPKLTAVVLTDRNETYVEQVIRDTNLKLATYQIIQNHIIWPDTDFPRTATRKVRRQIVQQAVDSRKADVPFIPTQDASQIHAVLQQISGATKPISAEQTIVGDLAIDSIKRLELVTLLEEKLLVAVDETMITPTTTVGQLEKIIDKERRTGTKHTDGQESGVTRSHVGLFVQSMVQAVVLSVLRPYQRLQVSGERLQQGPVIYAVNHTSHLDAPTFLRLAGFRGRQQLVIAAAADYFFKNSFLSWLSRNFIHAVPVEREGSARASLTRIGRELSLGRSVVIFPEGSRSRNGRIREFKPGIGLLAASLQVPVVPVRIEGNFELLPKGKRWLKRGRVSVRFGTARIYSVSRKADDIAHDLEQAVKQL